MNEDDGRRAELGGYAGPDPALGNEAADAFWLWRSEQYRLKGSGFPSRAVRNPEPGWLLLAAEESGGDGVRGLFVGGDLVWWHPREGVTHGEASRWLGSGRFPGRTADVEFHLVYENDTGRSGRILGSFFTSPAQETLERLLAHPSVAPHLDAKGEGLKL